MWDDEIDAANECIKYLNNAKEEIEELDRFKEIRDYIQGDIEELEKVLDELESYSQKEYEDELDYLNREYERNV